MHTVLVDALGWTLYELEEVVTDQEALQYLERRWVGPYRLSLAYDNDSIPPQKWINATYIPTGNVTVAAFIRERE